MRHRLLIIICGIITGLLLSANITLSYAQHGMDKEYLLKSVFLERFCRFIQWPDDNDGTGNINNSFVIGVIGDSPFNSILDKVYAKQTIKEKHVEIRYLETTEEIAGCHLLFIAKTNNKNLKKIIINTMKHPVLTVSDNTGYGHYGVHINMYLKDNQIQFEINNNALQKSNFTVSSLLLKVAKLVETSTGEN